MRLFTPKEDILRHGQMLAHVQLLVDDGDAKLLRLFRREISDLLAKNRDLALVARINAAENFHQRRFARAVFTEQRHDFAGAQIEGHVVQGFDARKKLADVGELNNCLLHKIHPPFSLLLMKV